MVVKSGSSSPTRVSTTYSSGFWSSDLQIMSPRCCGQHRTGPWSVGKPGPSNFDQEKSANYKRICLKVAETEKVHKKKQQDRLFFLRVHTHMVKNKYIISICILYWIIYRGSSSQLCIYELHLVYHACWMSSLCFVIFAHDTQPISWNQPTTLQTKKHVEPMNLPSWIIG